MERALRLAEKAAELGEVPVGAVLVRDGKLLGEGWNQPISACDPTAHAEIVALRAAAVAECNYRLPDSRLYVTIEPCTMCAGALVHARVGSVIYAATEPKAGAVVSQSRVFEQSNLNHQVQCCGGVLEEQARELMQAFFRHRRDAVKRLRREAQQVAAPVDDRDGKESGGR
ncbi:tRNA adenosine(34) deaminase TadA [Pseudomaricurvus sp. HS19]|nr:tRNA adenosine(34) deaminase TadA [Pseudomaricurvus sp. HS19]